MPYINQNDRKRIVYNGKIYVDAIKTAGELQYAIAVMIKDFIKRKGLNYQNCNDIMGAITGAGKEFYRRVVAPYEDLKIKDNGDV